MSLEAVEVWSTEGQTHKDDTKRRISKEDARKNEGTQHYHENNEQPHKRRQVLSPTMTVSELTYLGGKFGDPLLGRELWWGRGLRRRFSCAGLLESKHALVLREEIGELPARIRRERREGRGIFCTCFQGYMPVYLPEEWSDKLNQLLSRYNLLVEQNQTAEKVLVNVLVVNGFANLGDKQRQHFRQWL